MAIGSIIAAGASLASSGINAASQGNMNRKNRRFQTEMFEKQNAYNTPLKQVERMKEAGLNPALMYGGGQPQNTASVPNVSEGRAYQMPENLLADVYQKIANAELSQSKTVPLEININTADSKIENIQQDTELKKQATETGKQMAMKIASETARIQQEYSLNRELYNSNRQYREEQLRKLQNDNLKIEKELKYLDSETQQKIENLKQSYLESVQRTKSLDNQNWIYENDKQLRELYVNPNSSNMVDSVLRYIVGNGANLLEQSKQSKK